MSDEENPPMATNEGELRASPSAIATPPLANLGPTETAPASSTAATSSSHGNSARNSRTTSGGSHPITTTATATSAASRTNNGNGNGNGSRSRIITRTTATTITTNPVDAAAAATDRRNRWMFRFVRTFRQLFLLLTYPCMVLVTAISLVLVLIFFVMPTMICLSIGICVYYCFMEEPIPLSMLLRYVFVGEAIDGLHRPHANNDPNYDGPRSQADRELFRSSLIVRRLLRVEIMSSSSSAKKGGDVDDDVNLNDNANDDVDADANVNVNESDDVKRIFGIGTELGNNGDVDNEGRATGSNGFIDNRCPRQYPRQHPFQIQVWTENKSLLFSEPLVMPIKGDDDDDDDGDKENRLAKKERQIANDEEGENAVLGDGNVINVLFIPHYQRSTENQRSNRNLRETIVPNDDSVLERSRNVVDGQEAVISLDDTIESTLDFPPGNDVSGTSSNMATNGGETPTCQDCSDGNCVSNENESANSGGSGDNDDDANKSDMNGADTIMETDYGIGIEGDMRDRGTTCDICILEFEVGDEVAWSPNLTCSHTFHKDCILDWLVRKPTCPSCRQDYLKGNADELI